MGVDDRGGHHLGGLVDRIAEHDPLVAGALVLVARGIHAHGDVARLGVQQHVDPAILVVETFLFVTDRLHRIARHLFENLRSDRRRAAHLAREHNAVGGREGFAGDPRLGIGSEEGVDDRVGDPVADLVGMAFGDGLAGEQIVGLKHLGIPS